LSADNLGNGTFGICRCDALSFSAVFFGGGYTLVAIGFKMRAL